MRAIVIALVLVFAALQAGPVMADPPADKGQGHGKAQGKGNAGGGNDKGKGSGNSAVIVDKDRTIIREHFSADAAGGNCPPGLAKKNNGCMPPGQARKWGVGQAVPRDVTIYALPDPLLVRLSPAPVGYRYGRIGGDVVLLAIPTNIIVDIYAF
jgi:Ni/Co efflux regulator RcnB